MSARERFLKKVQQNKDNTPPGRASAEAKIGEFCTRLDELVLQVSQWLAGSGIELVTETRHISDLSTLGYSLSSGICRYDITALQLHNGERSASLIPEQLCRGSETGCVTLTVEAPGSSQAFYLSMTPDTGWFIRSEHQSSGERVFMTEDLFFNAIDRLA